MSLQDQVQKTLASIMALGPRRLAILGVTGALVVLGTSIGGYLLSRPPFETLYAGLDRQDVSRIGTALRDAGVTFDVSADGANVLVAYGQTSRARMLLAEQGLPHSSNVGYELFDKLGSLGLTSFMQDVTRARAMEGELGRTIQTMHGIRSARVHLVLPDEGSFRRARQPPSASVVIRAEGRGDPAMARAIRHLVASAIAGMTPDMVTVLTTDGETLASGGEGDLGASNTMLSLERNLSDSLQDNIRRTLAPYLGARNVQVSVVARLNTDKKQTSETIFNPESRVERSVRVIKENQVSQNSSSQAPVSVDRNIPSDKGKSSDGKQSNEENQKREELTNYEVSSKSVSTVSGGYAIDRLSVALVVNRAGLVAHDGSPMSDEAIAKKISEIEALAATSAGVSKERGDTVKVTAVDFLAGTDEAPPSLSAHNDREPGPSDRRTR